jgi:hypothetical protein
MIVKEFYETRKDGVNLYKHFDAVVDSYGIFARDESGNCIPTGFMIRKAGTDEIYSEAIDVEDAPFTYEETVIPIETEQAVPIQDGFEVVN